MVTKKDIEDGLIEVSVEQEEVDDDKDLSGYGYALIWFGLSILRTGLIDCY